jgi:hypothetical protein
MSIPNFVKVHSAILKLLYDSSAIMISDVVVSDDVVVSNLTGDHVEWPNMVHDHPTFLLFLRLVVGSMNYEIGLACGGVWDVAPDSS